MSIESVMPSNHLIFCHPLILLPSIFPASGSFPMSQLFASGGQSIGLSASTSVLPMNTQDWSPLGWTGWIFLRSKGLSKSSPTPQFKIINSLALSFLYSPTLTSIHDHCILASLITLIQCRGGTLFCGHGDARLVNIRVPYDVEKPMSSAIGENTRSRDREERKKIPVFETDLKLFIALF